MSTNKLSINELSTNERRDLVAAAASDDFPSPEALDAEIYRLVAAENHTSDYTHDPEQLRSQVYGALLSKIARQAGIDVEVSDPVTNSILERESGASADETDDDWASPIASQRSEELEAEAQNRAANHEEGWPSATASTRSAELDRENN